MINTDSLRSEAAALREMSPLVLNITNYVAMNFSANVLLAAGASPIMSFYPEEMEEIAAKCNSLVINIGCLDGQVAEGARRAAEAAGAHGLPWVLDPVGVGASAPRKELCKELILNYKPTIIRGNASEIITLAELICECVTDTAGGRGVDSTMDSGNSIAAACSIANKTGAVVSVSGKTDYITDGETILKVDGGSPVMPQITAMGCSASALTAAFAAVKKDPLEAAWLAMAAMASAGDSAAARTSLPGSFQTAFLDALATLGRKAMDKEMLKLYLVTDRGLAGDRDIIQIAVEAAKGGATMVQLREKDIDTQEFVRLGRELKKALQPLGVPLIINDRVDVALACDADGVHIGQSDMPYGEARRLLGPDKIIGLSVENMDQIEEANALDVDYIGVSPVFATPTKTDTATPFGLAGLREAVAKSTHPAVGIGGMNADTAVSVMQAGADGIAVVSAIVCAPDPKAAAMNLKNLVENGTERLG